MTGNWFAAFAILAWPVVAIIVYRLRPVGEATLWIVLGALLLLPSQTAIKIPMIPAIDKNSIASLSALVGYIVHSPIQKKVGIWPGVLGLLVAAYIFSPIITSVLNNDTIVVGDLVLPGVGYYDGISALLSQSILFLPFFIGRSVLRGPDDGVVVLRVLALAGLFYTLPMLFEVRMSPQLSNWIYGFFPSTFASEGRYGGFRPVVFMINGLSAAFFLSTAFVAAIGLWRAKINLVRLPPLAVNGYLGMVVLLCKSAGALVYTVVGGVLVGWMSPKMQLRIAVVVVSIGLVYPLLRAGDYFPTERLVDVAEAFNKDRAASLSVRFNQEQKLLEHASERYWFGWGRYGRSRVYEESGKDSTLTDGLWIITLGQFGLIGFLAQFGLLALPVFAAAASFRYIDSPRDMIVLCVLALIVAFTVIEQLPNASISAWSWLTAGALLGRCENIRRKARKRPVPSGRSNTMSNSSYARSFDAN